MQQECITRVIEFVPLSQQSGFVPLPPRGTPLSSLQLEAVFGGSANRVNARRAMRDIVKLVHKPIISMERYLEAA